MRWASTCYAESSVRIGFATIGGLMPPRTASIRNSASISTIKTRMVFMRRLSSWTDAGPGRASVAASLRRLAILPQQLWLMRCGRSTVQGRRRSGYPLLNALGAQDLKLVRTHRKALALVCWQLGKRRTGTTEHEGHGGRHRGQSFHDHLQSS